MARALTIGHAEEMAALATAVAQRLAGTPPLWDWATDGALCQECGLLLVKLPTTVRVERTVVVFQRPRQVLYYLTHAHAARARDGQAVCLDCVETTGDPCESHRMCDTPQPEMCTTCQDEPALALDERCYSCIRQDGQEWDKDRYLGQ